LQRTEAEITRRQRELQEEERRIERFRDDSERQRDELLKNAKNEARELLANANRDATAEVREAEARGARLLEQARHQATELTNTMRAEVDQTFDWARAQAAATLQRAQEGAEQLLAAAGLGSDKLAEVTQSLLDEAVERVAGASLVPVVAHPERSLGLPADFAVARTLVELGSLLCPNGDSFLGVNGPQAEQLAWRLVDEGLVALVASDGHRASRPPRLDAAYHVLAARYGAPA